MRHFMLSMFFLGLALCEDSPIITSINGRGKGMPDPIIIAIYSYDPNRR